MGLFSRWFVDFPNGNTAFGESMGDMLFFDIFWGLKQIWEIQIGDGWLVGLAHFSTLVA